MESLNIQVSGNFKLLILIVAVILPFCAYVALYLHIYGEEMGGQSTEFRARTESELPRNFVNNKLMAGLELYTCIKRHGPHH